jgi:ADP-L-glycero-D-manno-heptose 6-epimerase
MKLIKKGINMTKPIVVTGGAGFIGRNVVSTLNGRGMDDIYIVDRLDMTEKWKNLVGLTFEDFLDKDDFMSAIIDDVMEPVEAVIHLGACSSTTETDADYLIENNYRYTRELCEWCLFHDVRFITASSAATYGDGKLGYSDDDNMTSKYKPLNMYGFSKHMFDMWALKHDLYKKMVGLKYFNVYGPYEDHKDDMRSVVHKAYGQIKETGEVKLFKSRRPDYEDGKQVRDFIYVKDAVDMTLHFLDDRETNGLYNIGTGITRTWIDLVTAVFSAMDLEPNIKLIDMPEHLREKYQYHTQADMSKLKKTGYNPPQTTLEDGIKDYVQNYLAVDD